MPFATINNIVLYYELHGPSAAPPLVLIAGRSSDHSAWLSNLRTLAETFRVLVFDHRGVGRSTIPAPGYTIRDMAADTLGLMRRVGFERAHVVGTSMGGYIAQELALLAPQQIGALVLAGTVAHSDAWLDNVWTMTLKLAADEAQRETRVRQSLLLSFSPQFLNNQGIVDGLVQYGVEKPQQPLEGLRGHVAACRSHDTRGRLERIVAPTLVLAGEQDVLMPLARVRQVADAIPGAAFEVLPGGHAFMTESPQEFNAAVRTFLEEHNHRLDPR
ncbi:MAG TPA: alpha/beta fold hydrolase [Herpetosiphonaceae bacterium]